MLFCACRASDVLNAVVGLWLVPKYVGPAELGAVLPLTSFAGFLALPVSIFAMTFMKELTVLATNKEYGKMKSLMCGVFIGAAIFLLLALLATKLILPLFLERIRVAKGTLGILILAASFAAAVSPIYQNALQSLKRFKTISFLNIVGAPIRFIAMIATMPFRALSGYFVGQTAAPAFTIVASVVSLRKELSVPPEPYWTKNVTRRLGILFLGIAAFQITANFPGLIEQTVIRQRLPEIESAAYYMVTRFSDISGFIGLTLISVLFPFTAELAAKGKPTKALVIKAATAMLAASAVLAGAFAAFGKELLTLLPDGEKYAEFAWAIPWLIGINAIGYVQTFHTNTEVSAGRFSFLKWWVPLHIVFAAVLILVPGYGYFTKWLPTQWCNFLATHNLSSLEAMLLWLTVSSAIRLFFSMWELFRQPSQPYQ